MMIIQLDWSFRQVSEINTDNEKNSNFDKRSHDKGIKTDKRCMAIISTHFP